MTKHNHEITLEVERQFTHFFANDTQSNITHGIFVEVIEREPGWRPIHVDHDLLGVVRFRRSLLLLLVRFRVRSLEAGVARVDGEAGQPLREQGAQVVRLPVLLRRGFVDVTGANEVSAVQGVANEAVLVGGVPHVMVAPLAILLAVKGNITIRGRTNILAKIQKLRNKNRSIDKKIVPCGLQKRTSKTSWR